MTTRILGIDIGSAATRAVLVEARDDSSNVELIDIKSSVSMVLKRGLLPTSSRLRSRFAKR